MLAELLLGAGLAPAADNSRPELVIPRVDRAPALEDFLDMKPNNGFDTRLVKVENFVQRVPKDGERASQRTEAYLGYDDRNLYVIYVCFDNEPQRVRARLVPRENFVGADYLSIDDTVSITLDTFNDQRRAYVFQTNALGIQWDALVTEGGGFDVSFDTLWYSKGKRTPEGYVVWIAIPFKSLRFPATSQQTWGILLNRDIPRVNEQSFWPHVSIRVQGFVNQAGVLRGLENISPGRNVQFIPYGAFRSFRALDLRDPAEPRFVRDRADPDAGLDAKLVFRDSLVLDVTLNPDFSQVESDEPQVTVNQRFEVFFPEKRPFFLENANYFQTPIDLVFTRRIADPQYGVRLTGKHGPYALAAFLVDDQSPGRRVPPGDPLAGERALFGIVRVSRDIFRESSLGFIYTDREFEESFNRVGGADTRLKLHPNWVLQAQAVTSATRLLGGPRLAGPAYDLKLTRTGRHLNNTFEFNDRSPGFRTETGFLERADIRRVTNYLTYNFRPEGRYLINWYPAFFLGGIWDHNGRRLDWAYDNALYFELVGQTQLGWGYNNARERLRPVDFPILPAERDFNRKHMGFLVRTSYLRQVSLDFLYRFGQRINFFPPPGQEPFLADWGDGRFTVTLRPLTSLRIDNTYLLTRLLDRGSGAAVFNNHILRSRWNYQFTPRLSLRMILQYTATLANPDLTVLPTAKNFNGDFLITYLVNPGTALFIGYNGNAQNIELIPTATGSALVRHRNQFINDAKQFFVKFSYLFRF